MPDWNYRGRLLVPGSRVGSRMQTDMTNVHDEGNRPNAGDRKGDICWREKLEAWFFYFTAVILFVTALTKLFGAMGITAFLAQPDPLLPLSNRQMMILLGSMELFLSAFLLLGRGNCLKHGLTAWMAANFLVYRLGLWWLGGANLCNCLGNINHLLPVAPRVLNEILYAIIGFMLIGSCGFLLQNYIGTRSERKARGSGSGPNQPTTS
jgi:hypothetical protein